MTSDRNNSTRNYRNQKVAVRRKATAGISAHTRGGAPGRATRMFFAVLGAGYALAILWTSIGYAVEDRVPGTALVTRAPANRDESAAAAYAPMPAPAAGRRLDLRGYVQSAARDAGVDPRAAEWIVAHESGHRPQATGDGGESRGMWQINRIWHPEVSDQCAYDVRCSTHWSVERIRQGYINEWSTWKYRKFRFADSPPSLDLPK